MLMSCAFAVSDGHVIAILSVLFSAFTIAACAAAIPMLFQRLDSIAEKTERDLLKFKVHLHAFRCIGKRIVCGDFF